MLPTMSVRSHSLQPVCLLTLLEGDRGDDEAGDAAGRPPPDAEEAGLGQRPVSYRKEEHGRPGSYLPKPVADGVEVEDEA